MELVIVGSAGYDDIETPVGKVSGLLGGSAIYSGLSAAFHARDIGLQGLVWVLFQLWEKTSTLIQKEN